MERESLASSQATQGESQNAVFTQTLFDSNSQCSSSSPKKQLSAAASNLKSYFRVLSAVSSSATIPDGGKRPDDNVPSSLLESSSRKMECKAQTGEALMDQFLRQVRKSVDDMRELEREKERLRESLRRTSEFMEQKFPFELRSLVADQVANGVSRLDLGNALFLKWKEHLDASPFPRQGNCDCRHCEMVSQQLTAMASHQARILAEVARLNGCCDVLAATTAAGCGNFGLRAASHSPPSSEEQLVPSSHHDDDIFRLSTAERQPAAATTTSSSFPLSESSVSPNWTQTRNSKRTLLADKTSDSEAALRTLRKAITRFRSVPVQPRHHDHDEARKPATATARTRSRRKIRSGSRSGRKWNRTR